MHRYKPFAGSLSGLALALALAGPATAEAAVDPAAEYESCMLLTGRAPAEALASARSWEEVGGGNPARHCAAIALFNLRDYVEAAVRLDTLAVEIGDRDRPLTTGLFDQAGRAWLLAGEPAAAIAAFGEAIALSPADAELFIARSYAHAALRDYNTALGDLNRAESLAPGRAETYLLKAAALRFLGNDADALEQADMAAAIAPGDPDVFLERGNVKWQLGDRDGAARDWLRVEALAPDSAAAQAARDNLRQHRGG